MKFSIVRAPFRGSVARSRAVLGVAIDEALPETFYHKKNKLGLFSWLAGYVVVACSDFRWSVACLYNIRFVGRLRVVRFIGSLG